MFYQEVIRQIDAILTQDEAAAESQKTALFQFCYNAQNAVISAPGSDHDQIVNLLDQYAKHSVLYIFYFHLYTELDTATYWGLMNDYCDDADDDWFALQSDEATDSVAAGRIAYYCGKLMDKHNEMQGLVCEYYQKAIESWGMPVGLTEADAALFAEAQAYLMMHSENDMASDDTISDVESTVSYSTASIFGGLISEASSNDISLPASPSAL